MDDLAAQLGMAMDGYLAALHAERQAIERFFLLPDLENKNRWIQVTHSRHDMMKIVFERHADLIVHIVERYRFTSREEIDTLTEQINHLRSSIEQLNTRMMEL